MGLHDGAEMMAPETKSERAARVERGTGLQIRDKRRFQAGVEQNEAGGQHAGLGLNAADENLRDPPLPEMGDELARRQITVFREYLVGGDQTAIRRRRRPAELGGERNRFFLVQLEGSHRVIPRLELTNTADQSLRRVERFLDVNSEYSRSGFGCNELCLP